MTSRTGIPPHERRLRSRLLRLIQEGGLLRGNLLERKRKCGNPRCHCQHGEGHPGLYFAFSQAGKQRQLYIPHDWEERVRTWVGRYQEIRELLDQLNDLYRERIRNREDEPRSGASDATS